MGGWVGGWVGCVFTLNVFLSIDIQQWRVLFYFIYLHWTRVFCRSAVWVFWHSYEKRNKHAARRPSPANPNVPISYLYYSCYFIDHPTPPPFIFATIDFRVFVHCVTPPSPPPPPPPLTPPHAHPLPHRPNAHRTRTSSRKESKEVTARAPRSKQAKEN